MLDAADATTQACAAEFLTYVVDGRELYGSLRVDTQPTEGFSWSEPCMMGIDEAGRGPVLGPMVYGSCVSPIAAFDELKKMGFADSKQLTEAQRAPLFRKIKRAANIAWLVSPIPAAELSSSMCGVPKVNLNTISHNAAMDMVRLALARGLNVQQLFVDTVGSPEKYQALLKQTFPQIGEIVVTSKADSKFPIVSAASICAKETRDALLRDWSFPEAAEGALEMSATVGSGYPGDEVTKTWLRDHLDPVFALPSLVRFSWSTTTKLVEERCAPLRWGDEEDEGGNGNGNGGVQKKIGTFATAGSGGGKAKGNVTETGMRIGRKERAAMWGQTWPAQTPTTALPLAAAE